jgi:hypothetical protein
MPTEIINFYGAPPSIAEAATVAFELGFTPRLYKGSTSDVAQLVCSTIQPKKQEMTLKRLKAKGWPFNHHKSDNRDVSQEFRILVSL